MIYTALKAQRAEDLWGVLHLAIKAIEPAANEKGDEVTVNVRYLGVVAFVTDKEGDIVGQPKEVNFPGEPR